MTTLMDLVVQLNNGATINCPECGHLISKLTLKHCDARPESALGRNCRGAEQLMQADYRRRAIFLKGAAERMGGGE